MTKAPLRPIFNKFSTPSIDKHLRFSSPFSSNPSPKYSNFYSGDSQYEGSLVYQHKLRFQRPRTIESKDWLHNSATFIGRVVAPVTTINSRARFGVYTKLQVKSSGRDSFRILLKMWHKMAEISSQYLKQNDFIYVSGRLGSFRKVDENGHPKIFFEVTVDKLSYVAWDGNSPNNEKTEKPELQKGAISTFGASSIERTKDRLYLWQVFFACPHEWWDNRKNKKYPRSSDFKHKDTGECLWLSPEDPPWVGRQLQLQDSRKAELGYRDNANYRSRVSMWKYDE